MGRLLVAAVASALLIAACGEKQPAASRGAPAAAGFPPKAIAIPAMDPAAPIPALSANILEALAADVPELVRYRDAVLAAEREAIQGTLDRMRPPSPASPARRSAIDRVVPALIGWLLDLVPPAMADGLSWDSLQPMALGHAFGTLVGDVGRLDTSKGGRETRAIPGENGSVDAIITVSAEVGGPATVELLTKVDLPILLLEAKSKVKLTGSFCPNAEGKVEFTVAAGSQGRAGSGGSIIHDQNVEARVTLTVDDEANVVDSL